MNFFKYYNEKQSSDGKSLWWPGGPEGFPFKGEIPPLTTKKEYDNLQLSGTFRCRLFYLSNQEDVKEYAKIRDKCANGLYYLIDRDRQWDDEIKNYRIYLEWLELAYELPPNTSIDAVKEYKQNAQTINPINRLAGFSKDW